MSRYFACIIAQHAPSALRQASGAAAPHTASRKTHSTTGGIAQTRKATAAMVRALFQTPSNSRRFSHSRIRSRRVGSGVGTAVTAWVSLGMLTLQPSDTTVVPVHKPRDGLADRQSVG